MDSIKNSLIIIGLVIIVAIIVSMCSYNVDESLWNEGRCTCGGYWRYEQAVGHRFTTDYIYRCDKCGDIIEIGYYNEEIRVETEEERLYRILSYGQK